MRSKLKTHSATALLVLPLMVGAGFFYGGQSKAFRAAITGEAAALDNYLRKEKRRLDTDHSGRTVLHWLVSSGHVDAVERYLNTGVDVNLRLNRKDAVGPVYKGRLDALGLADVTLLTLAAFGGQPAAAELLLERGAHVNVPGSSGVTPLLAAARWADTRTVQLLLDNGADTEARDGQGLTPILAAIWGVQEHHKVSLFMVNATGGWRHPSDGALSPLATVELLLQRGADPHAVSTGNENALYLAAFKGDREMVDLLLAQGVDPNVVMNEGRNAALAAASLDHIAVAEQLVAHGAEPVVVEKLIRDFHGTAVLHDLVGRREEAEGGRRLAWQMYEVAAEYFGKAAWQCRTEAERRAKAAKRAELWAGAARGAYEGLLAINADIQARQMAEISALSTAARSGSGLGGYYALLDSQSQSQPGSAGSSRTGSGSYAFNQRLQDDAWTEVYAVRAVMAQRAAARTYLSLEERFADLIETPRDDALGSFLLTTRTRWLQSRLGALSEDFERDAAVSRQAFVDKYAAEVEGLYLAANENQTMRHDEWLVGYSVDEYLLTDAALYLMDTQAAIDLQQIVSYRVTNDGRRVTATVGFGDGRSLTLDGLTQVPSRAAMELLVPALKAAS